MPADPVLLEVWRDAVRAGEGHRAPTFGPFHVNLCRPDGDFERCLHTDCETPADQTMHCVGTAVRPFHSGTSARVSVPYPAIWPAQFTRHVKDRAGLAIMKK